MLQENFEKRDRISNDNYLAINGLRNKYGEVMFRMGIIHLFEKGYETFRKKNLERTIRNDYDKEKACENKKHISIITPEFVRDLNLCALSLSNFETSLLLKYITNHVYFQIK